MRDSKPRGLERLADGARHTDDAGRRSGAGPPSSRTRAHGRTPSVSRATLPTEGRRRAGSSAATRALPQRVRGDRTMRIRTSPCRCPSPWTPHQSVKTPRRSGGVEQARQTLRAPVRAHREGARVRDPDDLVALALIECTAPVVRSASRYRGPRSRASGKVERATVPSTPAAQPADQARHAVEQVRCRRAFSRNRARRRQSRYGRIAARRAVIAMTNADVASAALASRSRCGRILREQRSINRSGGLATASSPRSRRELAGTKAGFVEGARERRRGPDHLRRQHFHGGLLRGATGSGSN